ncbi:MAG: hypothetical protein HOE90_24575 [Bacteriovoracaceae bacterium]|jgi:hypothetical protein|nr:hypothetical protein [Bacteriovoracaceae bacterium]
MQTTKAKKKKALFAAPSASAANLFGDDEEEETPSTKESRVEESAKAPEHIMQADGVIERAVEKAKAPVKKTYPENRYQAEKVGERERRFDNYTNKKAQFIDEDFEFLKELEMRISKAKIKAGMGRIHKNRLTASTMNRIIMHSFLKRMKGRVGEMDLTDLVTEEGFEELCEKMFD